MAGNPPLGASNLRARGTFDYAVKALDARRIEAYALRYGSPDEPDRSPMKDFFTRQTELWLDKLPFPKPILLEHSMTPESDENPVVGAWKSYTQDQVGVKLAGELDTKHPLYPQTLADIKAGKMFLSSDSAPHLVRRKPAAKGTNEITRWPLITASLTRNPAEHRLRPVEAYKALGIVVPGEKEQSTTTTIKTDAQRRAELLTQITDLERRAELLKKIADLERRD